MTSKTLLHSILFTALVSAAPSVFAQDTNGAAGADGRSNAEAAAQADIRAEQLAVRYADVAGSMEAAASQVTRLQAASADAGAVAYGEIDTTMALSAAMVRSGAAIGFDTAIDTVSDLRAEGMGWGQVAQQVDVDLGAAMSTAHRVDLGSQVAGSATAGASLAERAGAGASTATDALDGAAGTQVDGARAAVDRSAAARVNADVDVDVDVGVDARGNAAARPAAAEAGARGNAGVGIGIGAGAPARPVLPERRVLGDGLL